MNLVNFRICLVNTLNSLNTLNTLNSLNSLHGISTNLSRYRFVFSQVICIFALLTISD